MSSWSQLPAPPATTPRRRLGMKIAIGVALLAVVGGVVVWKIGRSTYHDYQIASSAVDRFHKQLNAGDYQQIYDEATVDFQRSGSRETFGRVLDNIRQKMGAAGKGNVAGFHVNWRNNRLWVDQVFNTQFEKGQGQESFVWEIVHDQPRLYNYRVDSPNLK